MNIQAPAVEQLEPRIAPAALLTLHDVDGDTVTIHTSKGTVAQLDAAVHRTAAGGAGGVTIDAIDLTALDGTNHPIFAGSTLTVTAKRGPSGGDGLVNVGTVNATGIDLGAVSIDGDLKVITEGAAAASKFPSLTVYSMSGGGISAITGSAGTLTIKHDLDTAGVTVSGGLDSLKIGGSMVGGGSSSQGGIVVSGLLKQATVGGSLIGGAGTGSGALGAMDLGKVTISGSVLGGGGNQSGSITAVNTIGTIVVGGDLIGGTSAQAGTISSSTETTGGAQSITIKGEVQGNAQQSNMINLPGDLMSLTIGRSLLGGTSSGQGSVSVGGKLGAVVIGGSVASGPNGGSVSIGSEGTFGSIVIGGDFSSVGTGSAQIFTEGSSLGALTIKGSILTGSASAPSIYSNDHLGLVKIGGEIRGTATQIVSINAASKIDGLKVGGSVTWTNIEVSNGGAQMGAVKVGGSWTTSNLRVGVAAGQDGILGTADDIPATGGTTVSKIASIVIAGAVSGTTAGMYNFRFEAEQIVSFKAGGTVFQLTSGPHNDTDVTATKLEVGATGDVQIQEVTTH